MGANSPYKFHHASLREYFSISTTKVSIRLSPWQDLYMYLEFPLLLKNTVVISDSQALKFWQYPNSISPKACSSMSSRSSCHSRDGMPDNDDFLPFVSSLEVRIPHILQEKDTKLFACHHYLLSSKLKSVKSNICREMLGQHNFHTSTATKESSTKELDANNVQIP